MAAKKASKKDVEIVEETPAGPVLLTSKQEVADELKMSVGCFSKLLQQYPFEASGVSGRVNGRWRVTVDYVWAWHDYVLHQQTRHPDCRRLRPVEPPSIAGIVGR